MTWQELYPIVKTQAEFAVFRYEESSRRKDKIQELLAQCWEKYQRDVAAGKEVRRQDYKCFVTQRAKQVDTRSVCKKGYGGTSTIDVLSFYRRRPDSTTPVVAFDDWMTASVRNKQLVEDTLAFTCDFKTFLSQLNNMQKKILDLLIQGYKASRIPEMIKLSAGTVKNIIKQLKETFVRFFHLNVQHS